MGEGAKMCQMYRTALHIKVGLWIRIKTANKIDCGAEIQKIQDTYVVRAANEMAAWCDRWEIETATAPTTVGVKSVNVDCIYRSSCLEICLTQVKSRELQGVCNPLSTFVNHLYSMAPLCHLPALMIVTGI